MSYDDLAPRDQAFIDELGAGNKTVVSAQLVSALNGNGNAAIYLSQLLWWGKRKADEDGWFFRTREQMQDRCGLGKQAQRTAEKTLITLDIIETDRRGMPAKKHYRLDYEAIISLLSDAQPDTTPTRKAKSQRVGGATSSGGYVPEQDAGGTCQNPIESNTENNKRKESARVREDDPAGVKVWVDVTGERPNAQTRQALRDELTREEAPLWDEEVFRKVLREAWLNVGRDAHRIRVGYLLTSYEQALARKAGTNGGRQTTGDGKIQGQPEPDVEYNARGYPIQ